MPTCNDGEEPLITTELSQECPRVLAGILRGLKAAITTAA
jgi:hypothetical protein